MRDNPPKLEEVLAEMCPTPKVSLYGGEGATADSLIELATFFEADAGLEPLKEAGSRVRLSAAPHENSRSRRTNGRSDLEMDTLSRKQIIRRRAELQYLRQHSYPRTIMFHMMLADS